jgi:DNA-binding transcriptional ArsR family regulator
MRGSSIRQNQLAAVGTSPSHEAGRISASELAAVMVEARRMAHLAAIFSNPTRSKILMLLASHSKLSVSTLAILVGSSVSLVSHNLALMKIEGWIAVSNQGRMRQVRLASPQRLLAVQYLRDAGRIARAVEPSLRAHLHL